MPRRVAFVAPRQTDRVELMVELANSHPDLDLEVIECDLPMAEQTTRLAPHEMVILGSRVPMEVLNACPRLKFIQLMSAGFDTFDIGSLMDRGIQFANSSAAIAPAVAEHAITLMLAGKRRLVESWRSANNRRWSAEVNGDKMTELSGSTIGIVGLGHIGREVARRLSGWDAELLYYDAVAAPAEVEERLGVRQTTLDELLRAADVVTLHVSLNPATRHLIGERELRLMKPSAILVNTCRGPVVDEEALCRALAAGWIAGAGLDVLEAEPARPDNPLLDMPNVLVTPHVGGSSVQRVRRATEFALANVERVLVGEPALSLVRGQGPR